MSVFLEVRLSSDLQWQTLTSLANLANGAGGFDTVSVDAVTEARLRVVNNDGTNGADVRGEVETE